MILNYTKQQVAYLLGGSTTTIPTYFMLGSGSGTASAGQTALIAPTDRQTVTSTTIGTYEITWTGDWNSMEMSGLTLTEFGLTVSGTGTTGSMWSRTTFPGIQFNGTQELQVQETWEVF